MKAFRPDIDHTMNMELSRRQLAGVLKRLVEDTNNHYKIGKGFGVVYCENKPQRSVVFGIEWIEQESETKEG